MSTDTYTRNEDGWTTCRDADGEFGFALWTHEPSHRCVSVHQCGRKNWTGPVWGAEPADGFATGFSVTCRVHDELGNPESGEGFWVASFALAWKLGAKYREAVLGERHVPDVATQLTLDDAPRKAAP